MVATLSSYKYRFSGDKKPKFRWSEYFQWAHLHQKFSFSHIKYFTLIPTIWVKVFKNGPSKIRGKQPLENFTWFIYTNDGIKIRRKSTETITNCVHSSSAYCYHSWKYCDYSSSYRTFNSISWKILYLHNFIIKSLKKWVYLVLELYLHSS